MSLPPRELCAGLAISLVLAVSFAAAAVSSRLSGGALSVVCWLLVTAGVAGTFLAGRGSARGWLLLVMLQPVWVVYAIATDQHGFVIGALASCAAQLTGYARSRNTMLRLHPAAGDASSNPRPQRVVECLPGFVHRRHRGRLRATTAV
jgi:hypothetical protein